MKKTHSVQTNYFFHTLYQFLTLLTPFITTPYISRVLGPSGVGQYSYYYTLVQYFVFAGNLGFSSYGQIQIAKVRGNKEAISKTFWEIFIARFLSHLVCVVAYIVLMIFSKNTSMMIVLLGLLISSAIDISWLYFGLDDFKSISLRNILVKILGIVGIFIFVKTSDDTIKYAFILTLSTFMGSLLIWANIKDFVGLPDFRKYKYRNHIRPALDFFIPNIATMIYTMSDKTMIGLITNSDYQNGLYEQAHKIEQILVQFLLSISVVYKSQMARSFALNDIDTAKKNIKNAMDKILFLSFPICFGLISVSRDLVGCFLGTEFNEAQTILCVFSFLVIIVGISNCMSNMYLCVTDNLKKFQKGVFVGASINVLLNLCMIPFLGALGASIASVVSEFVILLVLYKYSKDYYIINDYINTIMKYLFLSVLMFLIIKIETACFLRPYETKSLIIEIVTGAVVYISGLVLMKDSVLKDMVLLIKKRMQKE